MCSKILNNQPLYATTNLLHIWKIKCSHGLSTEFMRPLSTNRIWFNKVCPTACGSNSKGGKSNVTYKPYKGPIIDEDHDHKNMRLKRPMSPHMTIMAPAMPAMTSIMQRITGTALVFYTLLLAGGTLVLPNGIESYVSFIQSLNLSRMSIFLIKFIVGFPFTYHYIIGIRFCMWNAGKWLCMKDVYSTGYRGIYASIAFAFLWALI